MPTPTTPPSTGCGSRRRWPHCPQAIRALPQPVIAAVNGPCVGAGLALCLAADIRICSTAATFGNGAILLGLSGGEMGMSYHLPRIVGTSVAADWMLTGRTVSAAEADRRGLVSELVEPDHLIDRALELASRIAASRAAGRAADQARPAGQHRRARTCGRPSNWRTATRCSPMRPTTPPHGARGV